MQIIHNSTSISISISISIPIEHINPEELLGTTKPATSPLNHEQYLCHRLQILCPVEGILIISRPRKHSENPSLSTASSHPQSHASSSPNPSTPPPQSAASSSPSQSVSPHHQENQFVCCQLDQSIHRFSGCS